MCACMHAARGVPVRCTAALHWCTVGPGARWQVEWYLAKANAYPEVRRKKAAAQVARATRPNPHPHPHPHRNPHPHPHPHPHQVALAKHPNPNPHPHPEQVALAKHRLYRADQATKQVGGAAHHCCGTVFVTFNTVEAAQG